VSALGLFVACSDDDGSAGGETSTTAAEEDTTTTTAGPLELAASEDLYAAVPDPVPEGEPGELLAVQELDPGDLPAAALYRVLYRSESIDGEPIAVSGVIAVPEGEAPADGRPVLTWAHGTTGLADKCAPSKDALGAVEHLTPFLDRGMVVVASDFEGLGTPGIHPYILGESEGRGTLDIVRAAQNLDVAAGNRVVIWGHSQGGHAALFANQIAEEWAPELEIVGTVAGAPPSQLPLISQALQGGPFQHYILMVGAGWAEAYDADLSNVASERALEFLPQVDQVCSGELADVFNDIPPEELLIADPATVEPWKTFLVENDPGAVVGASPILIIHGGNDEQIPVVSSELLLDHLCEIGQVVQRRVYPGQSHAGVIGVSYGEMLDWIDARLAGEPAPNDCEAAA
jgi:pimeloyl-ACP methyl ester carboxylesterase